MRPSINLSTEGKEGNYSISIVREKAHGTTQVEHAPQTTLTSLLHAINLLPELVDLGDALVFRSVELNIYSAMVRAH